MSEEQAVLDRCEQLLAEHPPATTSAREFLGAQFDLGLAWVHFPEGNGGLGLSPGCSASSTSGSPGTGAPLSAPRNPIGHGMGAPTVLTHGTDAQRARYLRPLFTGEEIWCQMFSEPGAGSDVASLSTTAVRDGDEWIVNGQKVWTTLAHLSRWGMIVARTNPDLPKHKGMTYFVVDMQAPGVDVRPLRQMTGRGRVQRGLLDRRSHPRCRAAGRRRRGLAGGAHHPDERAGVDRRRHPAARGRHDPRGAPRLAGRRRPPAGRARRAHPALDRGRGAAAHQHPSVAAALGRHARTRGLGQQDPGGRAQQAGDQLRGRPARRRGDALHELRHGPSRAPRWNGTASRRRSCACGPTRSRAAPPRS